MLARAEHRMRIDEVVAGFDLAQRMHALKLGLDDMTRTVRSSRKREADNKVVMAQAQMASAEEHARQMSSGPKLATTTPLPSARMGELTIKR